MSALQHFQFESQDVRMLVRDELPWWVLTDVCRVLEIGNSRQAASRLDDDERDGVTINDAIGRAQEMTIINESGLYSLILTSRKPAARRFKKWVTSVLLPTLRRTGRYVVDEADDAEWPVNSDRKVFGIAIGKVNAAARLIATANRVYGPEAARALWESDGSLPQLAGLGVGHLAGSAADDPAGCLRHLFNADIGKATPMRELVRAAMVDREGRGRLPDYGLLLDPADAPGFVAVANTGRWLAAIFAETQWCLEWDLALAKLPGARQHRQIQFGATRSRCVLIPRTTVLGFI